MPNIHIRTKSGEVIDLVKLRDALHRVMGETPPNIRNAWTLRDAMHALDAFEAALSVEKISDTFAGSYGNPMECAAWNDAISGVRQAAGVIEDDRADETLAEYERETNALHRAATDEHMSEAYWNDPDPANCRYVRGNGFLHSDACMVSGKPCVGYARATEAPAQESTDCIECGCETLPGSQYCGENACKLDGRSSCGCDVGFCSGHETEAQAHE